MGQDQESLGGKYRTPLFLFDTRGASAGPALKSWCPERRRSGWRGQGSALRYPATPPCSGESGRPVLKRCIKGIMFFPRGYSRRPTRRMIIAILRKVLQCLPCRVEAGFQMRNPPSAGGIPGLDRMNNRR